jgi:tetratricopeptide (TPR) repeat protein
MPFIHRWLIAFFVISAVGAQLTHAQDPKKPAQPPSGPGNAAVITPDEMMENALKLYDAGDFKECAAVVDRVRRLKPDHPKIKLIQGLFYIENKQSAEALKYLSEYCQDPKVGSKDYRGYAAIGKIYKKSFAFSQALRPLEQAQKLAPNEVNGKPVRAEIVIEYASVLQKLKRTKQAVTALKEAETLAPNDAGVQYQLGQVSFESQEYAPAVRYADRAIELTSGQLRSDPFKRSEYELLKNCNELKINVGRSQAAAKPDDAPPYFTIAEATKALGEAQRRLSLLDARDSAMQALSKDPKQHNWRVFLARIELELGGMQDAIDQVNEVLKDDPQNAAALQFRSEIQARMKAASAS